MFTSGLAPLSLVGGEKGVGWWGGGGSAPHMDQYVDLLEGREVVVVVEQQLVFFLT